MQVKDLSTFEKWKECKRELIAPQLFQISSMLLQNDSVHREGIAVYPSDFYIELPWVFGTRFSSY